MVNGPETTGGQTLISGEEVLVTPSGVPVASAAFGRRGGGVSRGGGRTQQAQGLLNVARSRLGKQDINAGDFEVFLERFKGSKDPRTISKAFSLIRTCESTQAGSPTIVT